jgi:ribosomal-protein-alanine N-acetyltransferase
MTDEICPLPVTAAGPLSLLHAACFPEDPWDRAAMARVLGLAGVFGKIAWDGEMPIGFVLARDLGDECEILALGVLPHRRRHGIARRLMTAVAVEATARRLGSIVLEVAADNDAARHLYAALGYVAVGRRPRYYRRNNEAIDALILRLRLDRPEACR